MADEARDDERADGVLAGLPATRPNRMGRRSRAPQTEATPKCEARPATTAATSRPAAPTPIAEPRRPRPVRAGHPGLAERADRRPQDDGAATGLAGSVVRVAGGLAAFGAGVAGDVLRGVGKRLPRR